MNYHQTAIDTMSQLGRAPYNLLVKKHTEDPSIRVQPWQVANYREMETNDLFEELSSLGIQMNSRSFDKMAEEFESPEELFHHISEEEEEENGQIYLILFELWRRLLSHYETISIFCDELDHQIQLYEKDPLSNEELLQTLFFELGDIIDDNVDAGQKPKTVLNHIKAHLACNLENSLNHFIDDQIERGNHTIASELISHFSEYLADNLWFDLHKIKLLEGAPLDHATSMMARFLEKLSEKPDISIYFAFLRHLIQIGDQDLFKSTVNELFNSIKSEEEFLELLHILFDFYNLNDFEKEKKIIQELIQTKSTKLSAPNKKIIGNLMAKK